MAQPATERQEPVLITRGAGTAAARAVQRRCQAGELVRVAPGIYVHDRDPQQQAECVREHWVRIVGELVPGSVVCYRSAYAGAPEGGVLILSHPTRFNRTIRLPGLRVALVRGPGALEGDAPIGDGTLHMASQERMLLENLTRQRGPEGRSRGEAAVKERLERIRHEGGAPALERVRERARRLCEPLAMPHELARLEALIDALLRSQPAPATAAAAGSSVADPACVAALQDLVGRLRARGWPGIAAAASEARAPNRFNRAFVEAWFDCSDALAGVTVEQARAGLLGGRGGPAHSAPMRELVAVYKLACTAPLCDTVPPFGEGFAQGLKARHGLMMRSVHPRSGGEFRSGAAAVPGAVEAGRIGATLAAGSMLALSVPDGLARAIYYWLLLWRVQPFDRGTEQMARLVMNAELSSVGQARIVVPTRVQGLAARSRERWAAGGAPDRAIRLMSRLQRWSASLDVSDLDRLLERLARERAFGPAAAPLKAPR